MTTLKTKLSVRLYKIRLNNQGYDNNGRYYGAGRPLYHCEINIGEEYKEIEFRADDKASAKAYVNDYIKLRYPSEV